MRTHLSRDQDDFDRAIICCTCGAVNLQDLDHYLVCERRLRPGRRRGGSRADSDLVARFAQGAGRRLLDAGEYDDEDGEN